MTSTYVTPSNGINTKRALLALRYCCVSTLLADHSFVISTYIKRWRKINSILLLRKCVNFKQRCRYKAGIFFCTQVSNSREYHPDNWNQKNFWTELCFPLHKYIFLVNLRISYIKVWSTRSEYIAKPTWCIILILFWRYYFGTLTIDFVK